MEIHRAAARRPLIAGPAIAAIALLAALVVRPPAVRAADTSVGIVDFAYAPAAVTVTVGDTVTWTNRDGVEHTVTSDAGAPVAFDSGLMAESGTFSVTFTQPGTYAYHCTPHPSMVGTVTVLPAAQPSSAAATVSVAPSATVSDTSVGGSGNVAADGALAGLFGLMVVAVAGAVLLRLGRSAPD